MTRAKRSSSTNGTMESTNNFCDIKSLIHGSTVNLPDGGPVQEGHATDDDYYDYYWHY